MAIAFRNSVGSNNAGGTSSITMTMPTNVNGDLLIMQVTAHGGSSITISTPSGWTFIREDFTGAGAGHAKQAVFWRTASSEPGSYVVNITSSKASGTVTSISGANTPTSVLHTIAGKTFYGIFVNQSNGDVFDTNSPSGAVYKQTGGTGAFTQFSTSTGQWYDIAVNPSNGDVYATAAFGDVTKYNPGADTFDPVSGGQSWTMRGVAVNSSNGDVFTALSGGDIYKQTAGSGAFNAQSAGNFNWLGLAVNSSNGSVYGVVQGGDIYKQTNGTGSFVSQSAGTQNWEGVTIHQSTGDVYAITDACVIYKQTAGSGSFVSLGSFTAFLGTHGLSIDASNDAMYITADTSIMKIDILDKLASQTNSSSATITAPTLRTYASTNGIDLFLGGTAVGTTAANPTNYTAGSSSASTGGSTATRTTSGVSYRALSTSTTVGSLTATYGASGNNIGQHLFITETVTITPSTVRSLSLLGVG